MFAAGGYWSGCFYSAVFSGSTTPRLTTYGQTKGSSLFDFSPFFYLSSRFGYSITAMSSGSSDGLSASISSFVLDFGENVNYISTSLLFLASCFFSSSSFRFAFSNLMFLYTASKLLRMRCIVLVASLNVSSAYP